MALVLDTGVIYAALDEADADHQACADVILESNEQLVIVEPVLVELDYWIRKYSHVDAWLTFAEDVEGGAYALMPVDADLLVGAARLQARYADQPIGFVDAAVFTACELLGEDKVATLDSRHFGTMRTKEGRALRLLPADS
jgi:uncharacterized protein